jgi:hypothetical protein
MNSIVTFGKSVRLYLSDGTVGSIRHAEIVNWTGQAISCPRNQVSRLGEWGEAKRPGVYFLFGLDPDSSHPIAYVGEAEVVIDRLVSHVGAKEFWNEAVFFTNKDENLTKAHVKYLEARLIELALRAKRYRLENATSPQVPMIPRSDREAMEEFISHARILLGVLGHRILDPLAQHEPPTVLPARSSDTPKPATTKVLHIKVKGISAKAIQTDEGMVVLEGSKCVKEIKPSLGEGYRRLREKLLSEGALTDGGDQFAFTCDWLFSSPSQAAAVIVGYSINGRDCWMNERGESITQIEAEGTQGA